MIQKPEIDISPKEYEDFVKEWFDEEFGELNDYESKVRTKEQAHDGEFEIDIKIKFRLSGFDFLLLVECKKHKNRIKREVAQILHQKMQSLGAQKAVICSTSDFQSGTLKYSQKHGIACIRMAPGESNFHTRSKNINIDYDPCEVWGIPRVIGWLQTIEGNAIIHSSLVSSDHKKYIQEKIKS